MSKGILCLDAMVETAVNKRLVEVVTCCSGVTKYFMIILIITYPAYGMNPFHWILLGLVLLEFE
jgi:hypothetical protein